MGFFSFLHTNAPIEEPQRVSIPIQRAFCCWDCGQVQDSIKQGVCLVCGSQQVLSVAKMLHYVKSHAKLRVERAKAQVLKMPQRADCQRERQGGDAA